MSSRTGEKDPLWYKDAVIYQLHVKAFADSNADGIGDFGGITNRLDYLQDLGVTAIWLLPFYPSPQRDDGYDIADYDCINPTYGDLASFRRLLKEAHARNLRVIIELVINHTSDEHAWFQRARRAPRGSVERDFYVWSDTAEPYGEARIIFQDFETSNWTWDPVAGQYYWHRFYSHQPDLNYDNPAVHKAVLRALDKWLAMGVDGVRLDAIPYLYEREGTNCENLPETHAFLKKLRAHVDERFSDRMLLAEANQWPEDAVAYFGAGDECHMAFHFPLMPRLYMALQMEDGRPIVDILAQTPAIPAESQWAMFLRNHDELTLEMVTDEERDYMYRAYAYEPRMRINLGIRRRLAPLLQNDRRKIELLNALLFSLPGTPVLYYGDEIGMGDNVYLGDRNGVRTPMQWSRDRNAGFSLANPQQLYLPVIIDPQYHYETVNVESQRANPSSLWWWMNRLIALRNRHAVFGRGGLEVLEPENAKVLAFIRRPPAGEDGEVILVVANLSRYAQATELDLRAFAGHRPVELFGHNAFAPVGEAPYYLTLAPYGFYWFRLDPVGTQASSQQPLNLPLVKLDSIEKVMANASRVPLETALARWMPSQRWFAGKSRILRSVTVREAVEVGGERLSQPALLLLVCAEFSEGDAEMYCVPVSVATGTEAAATREQHPERVIARVSRRDRVDGEVLVDALADERFIAQLVQVALRKRTLRGERGDVEGWSTATFRDVARHVPLPPRSVGVEQSNTSVLLDDTAILKVFRRLGDGTSPDLEIGRHLSARAFPQAASVLGSLEYVPARGERTTLAIVHEFKPNEGDAWHYALDKLTSYYEAVRTLGLPDASAIPTRRIGPAPRSAVDAAESGPSLYDLVGTFLPSAELLGRRTAEMHIALSAGHDPDFAPQPFTTLYQRSLYQSLLGEVRTTRRMLTKLRAQLPDDVAELAQAINDPRLQQRIEQVRAHRIDAVRTRIHGDYHLGQVLWDGRDFVIIDFEGEPSRSIGQRKIKRSPVRDVAGMLASFHYAAHFGLREQVDRGNAGDMAAAHAGLDRWAKLWTVGVGNAFVDGYLQAGTGHRLLPADEGDARLLLDLFLAEKVCYEIRYELDNRPGWVDIPLRALADLVRSFPEVGS